MTGIDPCLLAPVTDERLYYERQRRADEEYEARCARCGACCGLHDGDPCVNLIPDGKGTYLCRTYETRFAAQRTVSGKPFTCVPIADVLRKGARYPSCAYARRS